MNFSKFLFSLAKTPLGDFIVGNTFESFSGLLPVDRIFENEKVIAFWHPKPFWDKHVVIVPKKKIKNVISIDDTEFPYINEVFKAVKLVVEKLGWTEYTLLVNGGDRQDVNQIHFHLCSGKEK
jgi:histidine triad (HIT) family protein